MDSNHPPQPEKGRCWRGSGSRGGAGGEILQFPGLVAESRRGDTGETLWEYLDAQSIERVVRLMTLASQARGSSRSAEAAASSLVNSYSKEQLARCVQDLDEEVLKRKPAYVRALVLRFLDLADEDEEWPVGMEILSLVRSMIE